MDVFTPDPATQIPRSHDLQTPRRIGMHAARTSDRWTRVELRRSRSSGPDGTLVEHPSSQARRPTQPTACAGRPSRRRAEVCCASAAPTRGARLWVRSPVCAGARKRAVQVCRAVRHTALSAEATSTTEQVRAARAVLVSRRADAGAAQTARRSRAPGWALRTVCRAVRRTALPEHRS